MRTYPITVEGVSYILQPLNFSQTEFGVFQDNTRVLPETERFVLSKAFAKAFEYSQNLEKQIDQMILMVNPIEDY